MFRESVMSILRSIVKGPPPDRAAFLQDRGHGRIGDRRKDRQENSGDSGR